MKEVGAAGLKLWGSLASKVRRTHPTGVLLMGNVFPEYNVIYTWVNEEDNIMINTIYLGF
jgi:hypothetical protein